MAWIYLNPFVAATYGLLFLSILTLWLPAPRKAWVWLGCYTIAVSCGYSANLINNSGLLAIIAFALVTYIFSKNKQNTLASVLTGLLIVVLGFALKFHLVPGFHNLHLFQNVRLTPDAVPYSFYLNIDEATVGIFILGWTHHLISRGEEWQLLCKQTLPRAGLVITVIALLSYGLGVVRFEPKFPPITLVWSVTNLFIVCLTEEAYFRGFIQKTIAQWLSTKKYGEWFAILFTAIFFGAMHYPGGAKYVLLAAIAGVGYGWIYARTKSIEASMLTHFSLNLLQFLFFTYPALAVSV
jgi:membrane protease YdiL (CAAX protease family)